MENYYFTSHSGINDLKRCAHDALRQMLRAPYNEAAAKAIEGLELVLKVPANAFEEIDNDDDSLAVNFEHKIYKRSGEMYCDDYYCLDYSLRGHLSATFDKEITTFYFMVTEHYFECDFRGNRDKKVDRYVGPICSYISFNRNKATKFCLIHHPFSTPWIKL